MFSILDLLSAYHAGLNNKLRTSVLDDWISAKTQVVVATVAFGYGYYFLQLKQANKQKLPFIYDYFSFFLLVTGLENFWCVLI